MQVLTLTDRYCAPATCCKTYCGLKLGLNQPPGVARRKYALAVSELTAVEEGVGNGVINMTATPLPAQSIHKACTSHAIVKISVSATHAAAIDKTGRVYVSALRSAS